MAKGERFECSDCGLLSEDCGDALGRPSHPALAGHEGICCDCFDETLGMSAEHRIRPRPQA